MSKKLSVETKALLKRKFSESAENIQASLIEACKEGDLEVVQKAVRLINTKEITEPFQKHGVKLDIDAPEGGSHNSALITAIDTEELETKVRNAIVGLLLKNGADPNFKNKYKKTPLMFAAKLGDRDSAYYLLLNRAKPNLQDEDEDTALTIAASEGHAAIVRMLIDEGAKVNHENEDCQTALILAADRGQKEVVDELLDEDNIKLDVQNSYGNTALMRAISSECPEIAQMLLKGGADPNVINRYGRTALVLSAKHEDFGSLKALLAAEAKTDAASTERIEGTALDIAISNKNIAMIKAILENTHDPIPVESIEKYLSRFDRYDANIVEILNEYAAIENYSSSHQQDGAAIQQLKDEGFWPGLD